MSAYLSNLIDPAVRITPQGRLIPKVPFLRRLLGRRGKAVNADRAVREAMDLMVAKRARQMSRPTDEANRSKRSARSVADDFIRRARSW